MSNKIAGIFACCTLLMIGSIVLLKESSLDLNTVIYACQYSLFGAITAGLFGFFIGKVLDTANSNKSHNHKNFKKSKSANKKSNNTEGENFTE